MLETWQKKSNSNSFLVLLPGVMAVLLAGMLAVGTQSMKAANANPADALRSE